MQSLLFEMSYWMLIPLALLGAALIVAAGRRAQRRFLHAGLGVLALTALLGVLNYSVETDREQVIQRTHGMVDAIVGRDSTTLKNLLHPQAVLGARRSDEIVHSAGLYADMFGLKGARIGSLRATANSNALITVEITAYSQHSAGVFAAFDSIPSRWQLDWRPTREGWRVKSIKIIQVARMDGRNIERRFFGATD